MQARSTMTLDPELPGLTWYSTSIDIYSARNAGDERVNTVAFEKGRKCVSARELLKQACHVEPSQDIGNRAAHLVPIRRTIDFDAAREVSELLGASSCAGIEASPWSGACRSDRQISWTQTECPRANAHVAYSARAPPRPVSMPLSWEELADAHPLDFRLTK